MEPFFSNFDIAQLSLLPLLGIFHWFSYLSPKRKYARGISFGK